MQPSRLAINCYHSKSVFGLPGLKNVSFWYTLLRKAGKTTAQQLNWRSQQKWVSKNPWLIETVVLLRRNEKNKKHLYGPWMAAWKSNLCQIVQRSKAIWNPCQKVIGARSILLKRYSRDLLSTATIRRAFSLSTDGKCLFWKHVNNGNWKN